MDVRGEGGGGRGREDGCEDGECGGVRMDVRMGSAGERMDVRGEGGGGRRGGRRSEDGCEAGERMNVRWEGGEGNLKPADCRKGGGLINHRLVVIVCVFR